VQLNYHTDYALRVLTYLAVRPGRRVSTREMAEFYGISLHHLTKVAKFLSQRGWLVTTRAHAPLATALGRVAHQNSKFVLLELAP